MISYNIIVYAMPIILCIFTCSYVSTMKVTKFLQTVYNYGSYNLKSYEFKKGVGIDHGNKETR